MTQCLYEIWVHNGRRTQDHLRYETDFTAPLPVGTEVYFRFNLPHDDNLSGLKVGKIFHELPLPWTKDRYGREGRVIMKLENGKGEDCLRPATYDRLIKLLKKAGWRSRFEHDI